MMPPWKRYLAGCVLVLLSPLFLPALILAVAAVCLLDKDQNQQP